MSNASRNWDGKVYNNGFNLVAIIAILASVAVPFSIGYRKRAKQQVCNVN